MPAAAGRPRSPLNLRLLDDSKPRNVSHMLRLLAVLTLFCGFVQACTHADEAEFIRVWPAWRDAQSFDRIGEYFGRPEANGRETVLRTQASARAGYYFLVR